MVAEEDAIYMLALNKVPGRGDHKVLFKLYEMEDNIKIQTLMKKSLYGEAKTIAENAKFPAEILSEIHKEYGDKLYSQKNFD